MAASAEAASAEAASAAAPVALQHLDIVDHQADLLAKDEEARKLHTAMREAKLQAEGWSDHHKNLQKQWKRWVQRHKKESEDAKKPETKKRKSRGSKAQDEDATEAATETADNIEEQPPRKAARTPVPGTPAALRRPRKSSADLEKINKIIEDCKHAQAKVKSHIDRCGVNDSVEDLIEFQNKSEKLLSGMETAAESANTDNKKDRKEAMAKVVQLHEELMALEMPRALRPH